MSNLGNEKKATNISWLNASSPSGIDILISSINHIEGIQVVIFTISEEVPPKVFDIACSLVVSQQTPSCCPLHERVRRNAVLISKHTNILSKYVRFIILNNRICHRPVGCIAWEILQKHPHQIHLAFHFFDEWGMSKIVFSFAFFSFHTKYTLMWYS